MNPSTLLIASTLFLQVEVPARDASWNELLERGFDPGWILPTAPRDADQVDLVARARGLLSRRCEPIEDTGWRCFGDLVRDVRAEPERRGEFLRLWFRRNTAAGRDCGEQKRRT